MQSLYLEAFFGVLGVGITDWGMDSLPEFKEETCCNSHRNVAVVVARPFPRDGDMAENHGAPEAGQLSRAWTRGRRERESPMSERRRVCSWTVQNDTRGVLGRVSAGAAGRILDSANPCKIKT